MAILLHQIRASFTADTTRVYQAYSHKIADGALQAQTFVPPFKMDRMTWIKPSFCWMMYRSGWGSKSGQERILAIDITREGCEWCLAHACLSHFVPGVYRSPDEWSRLKAESPVRVQWDPERNPQMERLEHRSIQIGLAGEAVKRYVHEWITAIPDVTAFAREVHELVQTSDEELYAGTLPEERPFPVPSEIGRRIGITMTTH